MRLELSPDGRYLVSSSVDRTVRVWDTQSWDCQHVFSPILRATAERLAFAGEHVLVVGHRDGWVTTWNMNDGTPAARWMAFGDALSGIATTCDGRVLTTCRSSDELRVFQLDGEPLANLKLDVGYVQSLVASEDGQSVVYAGPAGENRRVDLGDSGQ